MALGSSMFLWKPPRSVFKEGALITLYLVLFMLFSYLTMEGSGATLEYLPLRMLALCICFSVTSIQNHKTRYLVMAQVLWLWIEFFGGVSLVYRGLDMPWTRVVAIGSCATGSVFMTRISREMEFVLMVYWIAIWMFF
jgi:hypothetical protein